MICLDSDPTPLFHTDKPKPKSMRNSFELVDSCFTSSSWDPQHRIVCTSGLGGCTSRLKVDAGGNKGQDLFHCCGGHTQESLKKNSLICLQSATQISWITCSMGSSTGAWKKWHLLSQRGLGQSGSLGATCDHMFDRGSDELIPPHHGRSGASGLLSL